MPHQNKGIIMQKTKTIFFSKLLNKWHPKVFNDLKSILEKHEYKVEILKNTKDIWIRDFMPIVFDNKAIQYQHTPDYLINTPSNIPFITDPNLPIEEVGIKTDKIELILDGGNIVKNNGIVIVTDKLFTENRDLTPKAFEKNFPNIKKLIVIPRDPDSEEVYGHADGMVRFISDNHLLINSQYPKSFKKKLHSILTRAGFICTELKVKEDTKYAWGYINFLHIDNLIIQPSIDKVNDMYIKEQLKVLYPEVNVELCNALTLVKQGGVFNCVSWEL